MKKYLHYLIGLGKMIMSFGLIMIVTTSTIAQNPIADTSEQGYSMIDVDLSINPRFSIQYSDIPDTIFVYERIRNNTLVLYDKYVYNQITKRWLSQIDSKRPCVEISKRKRKDAKIVNLKPDKPKTKK